MKEKIPQQNLEKDKLIKGLKLAIIISLFFMTLLFLLTIDGSALKRTLLLVHPRIIFSLVALLLFNWFTAALQLKILIHTLGEEISFIDCLNLFLIGAFISSVTPFATGGGPFQIFLLHRKGISVGKGTTVILTLFILRIFFFLIASATFIIFFNWAISPGLIPDYIFYLAFGSGILFSTGIIIYTLVPGLIDKSADYLVRFKPIRSFLKKSFKAKRILARAKMELEIFRESIEILNNYKLLLFLTFLCTVIYWSSIFMIIPVTLKGLGLEPNFFKSYIMQTIINLVLPYMPTPGASGIAEIGFASMGHSYIPQNLLGIVTLVWRFCVFYIVLIAGGILTMKELSD